MYVKDYMTPDPLVVHNQEPVQKIAELIHRHRVHQVPVVDESNRLVGIVTDRDVRSAIGLGEHKQLGLVAEDIMTSEVITITPGQDLKDALDLLCRHHFGALPVVVGDHVVGILSTRDLLRRLSELIDELRARKSDKGVHFPANMR